MRNFVLFSVVCLQLGWTYGVPAGQGVGAFAYQDSAGNRYGGTYGLDDAQVYSSKGKDGGFGGAGPWSSFGNYQPHNPRGQDSFGGWGNFAPFEQDFQQLDDFFPEYFNNLQTLLNEAFNTNLENQKLAYNAAKKAFDLTSNQAGYIPNFTSRSEYDFGGFPFMMPLGSDSAYAGAAAGPGYSHQIAALNPENPSDPNINVMKRFRDTGARDGNFVSVSSSSYSSSANINGQPIRHKGAETLVNNNGRITHYKVQS